MDNIIAGQFYFLEDDYFALFPEEKLMQNKEVVNGKQHNRPCFFVFKEDGSELLWMIPISSQTEKFHAIEQKKIARYGKCETILFGEVLGHEKAFLLQNMCPVLEEHIAKAYIETANQQPVKVDGELEKKVIKTARRVLSKARKGVKLLFTDIITMEAQLTQIKEIDKGAT